MKKKIVSILIASLLMASTASAAQNHVVNKGDTLFQISKKYNVTVENIKKANDLNSDVLKVNQKLIIPSEGGQASSINRETVKERPESGQEESSRSLNLLLSHVKTLATSLVGTPYRYGGSTTKGFDCSGFTSYVMAKLGVKLPRSSDQQFAVGKKVDKANLRTGDLIFFDTLGKGKVSHVGIYIGNNKMIHSATRKVEVSDLNWYYKNYPYYGAKRVLTASR